MSNSKLATFELLSPYNSGPRTYPISRITNHIAVGQISIERLGAWFYNNPNDASCNYGIGEDGTIGLFVDEGNRSWASNSRDNDNRSVTIECASNSTYPYALNDEVFSSLISLCVDICRRNGKTKLIWIPDKDEALSYNLKEDEMLLTAHRWFYAVECPGDWLYHKNTELASRVNSILATSRDLYRVQIGAFRDYANAEAYMLKAKEAGFTSAFIAVEKDYFK